MFHSISDLPGLLCRKRVGGSIEVQDTVMEARGPSNVNTVDTAAFQPRYSLRSTDKVNRRESSVTQSVTMYSVRTRNDNSRLPYSAGPFIPTRPPPPNSPDLTVASLPGDYANVLPHTH